MAASSWVEMTDVNYDERTFYGTWRVSKFEAFDEKGAASKSTENEIEGTELTLEEGNDVRWKIPSSLEMIPLFSCESYEVILTHPAQLIFRSSSVGRVGPFAAEFDTSTRLQLTFDKAFVLFCEKVPQAEQIQESPFSFLSALEMGYFSDLVVTSLSGKNYHAHRVILTLGCPKQIWDCDSASGKQLPRSYQACVLDGLPDSVLSTVLHFIYSESLPPGLSENSARECANSIAKINGLEQLAKLCRSYLENYAVRTQIEHLCDDLETCGRKINNHIRLGPDNSQINSEPAAFWHGLKYAIREFAVAFLKVMQICKLFSDRRNELSREERHGIMRHCQERLPRLFALFSEFCEVVMSFLTRQSPEARAELASYFLTEADPLFDEASKIFLEVRKTLEAIIDSDVGVKRRQKESLIARTLKSAVHIKELAKLRRMHSEMVEFINNLMLKREHFSLLSAEEKVEAVSHVIDCTSDEISDILDRITNGQDNIDDRLTWAQWKYFFKMGAAKVAWIIEKSKYSKKSISAALGAIRKLVKREDFDAALVSLGIIDGKEKNLSSTSVKKDNGYAPQPQDVESLCVSPVPRDSVLSSHADKLFTNLESPNNFSDMKFIVHFVNNDGDSATKIIPAHRVIVACRCDWFRKALLSGMKEDIKREIDIYDCDPDLFFQFLRYLYTGRLECSTVNMDTLADLIAVSDQYEVDSLKSVCEGALKPQITNENVLELLSIGEQFNAASLRECCMDHVLQHPELLESEIFNELPPKLQVEVRDLTEWNQRHLAQKMAYVSGGRPNFRHPTPPRAQSSLFENNADLSSEMDMIDQLTHALNERHLHDAAEDASEEEGEEYVCAEIMESCRAEMRAVLGPDISQDELEQIAIAADFDVNRAVNFYFTSQGSS